MAIYQTFEFYALVDGYGQPAQWEKQAVLYYRDPDGTDPYWPLTLVTRGLDRYERYLQAEDGEDAWDCIGAACWVTWVTEPPGSKRPDGHLSRWLPIFKVLPTTQLLWRVYIGPKFGAYRFRCFEVRFDPVDEMLIELRENLEWEDDL